MRPAAAATLGPEHTDAVVEVLSESFSDYPVMRFVLGLEKADYEEELSTLVRFFVMARVLRNEIMLGAWHGSVLEGVALVSYPMRHGSPPGMGALREEVWARLGPFARARYEAFGAACANFEVMVPHVHLNMLGVRGEAQGSGLARTLIEEVHRISLQDPKSSGVTLSTEDEGNVPLYQHFGYEIVGCVTVGPTLKTWGFFRPDRES